MKKCCNDPKTKKCIRQDKKIFSLPRRFSMKQCKHLKGYSMKASCAPYKYCNMNGGKTSKKKKTFLYHPNNPNKSFDVYIDKNPNDTIPIKYTTVNDIKHTIKKLEKLYKTNQYSHKRIWQVGMIMKVRLETMYKHKKTLYPNAKFVYQRFLLANKYFKFLGQRTKQKSQQSRKSMVFKF